MLCPPARCQARTRAGLAGDGGKSTWRLPGSRERLSPTRRNWRAGPARLRVRDSGRPRRRPAGSRKEIAFIVVASAIGKDEVFDSINTAANTRYEVVGVRCPAEWLATVKTAPGLQVGQTLAQRLRRGQPASPEKVAVKALLFGGDFVDRCDHPGPAQLDQRPDQWGQAHELVARARAKPYREPGGIIAVQSARGE